MAIQTATGVALRRTTNLPTSTTITICGWARYLGVNNADSVLCAQENATTNATVYSNTVGWTAANAFSLFSSTAPTTVAFPSGPAVGDIFFWAVTSRSGTGNLLGYWKTDEMANFITASGNPGGASSAMLSIASNSYNDFPLASVWGVKIYTRPLTAAELLIESKYRAPKSLMGIYAYYPLEHPADVYDRSPMRRHLTQVGTCTYVPEFHKTVLNKPAKRIIRVPLGVVTGSLSVTLGLTTITAQGSTTIIGNASNNLSAVTSSASGATTVVGSLSITLENVSVTASGTVGGNVSGTLAQTLGNVISNASGTTTILSNLSVTLDNVNITAIGTTTVLGNSSNNLNNVTVSAAGNVGGAVSGALSQVLQNVSVASSGTTTVIGVCNLTLEPVTVASSGITTIRGTLSIALGDTTITASGFVGAQTSLEVWRFLALCLTRLRI